MIAAISIMRRRPDLTREAFNRHWGSALILGIALSTVRLILQFFAPSFSGNAYNLKYALYSLISGLNTWCWVAAVLGLAERSLSFTNKFLKYFNI